MHVVAPRSGASAATTCDRVVDGRGARLPRAHGRGRRAANARPLVRPDAHPRRHRTLPAEVPAARRARRRQGAPQGPAARGRQADTRASGTTSDSSRTRRWSSTSTTPITRWTRSSPMIEHYREHAVARHPQPVRPLPHPRRRAQGRRRRQRRDALLDLLCSKGPTVPNGDHVILQVKEAQASVLEPLRGRIGLPAPRAAGRRGPAPHPGRERHLPRLDRGAGAASGSTTCASSGTSRARATRWPWTCRTSRYYGALCGMALARAHARTGDPVRIAAYLGRSDVFDRAIVSWSAKYAVTNAEDHARLVEAIDTGRVEAAAGRLTRARS